MFNKRWNFITVNGIQIGIDVSWLFVAILLTWTLAVGYFPISFPGHPISAYWLMGFLGMIGLFVCIVLHELGHAFMAKHFNLPFSQITLFLFGGVAEIKQEPKSPKVEFLVAVAGPIVTLFLCFVLTFFTRLGQEHGWSFMATGITNYLASINLLILFFNLIPAFPLDGGRIFRALLWKWKDDLGWATKITTRFGMGFGFFLLFFGIFLFITGNPIGGIWLAILGLFLQRAASASQTQFYVSKALKHETVEHFMTKQIDAAQSTATLSELLQDHIYKSHHTVYPVIGEDHEFLGYVSLQEMKLVAQEDWNKTPLSQVLIPRGQCSTISPSTHALEALAILQEAEIPTIFVLEEKKLIGILTAQDLFKIISLKLAVEEHSKR